MKQNRIMAFAAAAVFAAMPVISVTAADTKITPVSPVLEDFNKNDVNGRAIVRMPAGVTADAEMEFSSPEGEHIAYYKTELGGSEVYSFDIEGRDNTSKDYRRYTLHLTFKDEASGSITPSLDLSIEVPDGDENADSFTVYDYTFVLSEEDSAEAFTLSDEPFSGEKIGDVYYPSTYFVNMNSYMMGDINGDKKLTAADASLVLVECAELADGGTGNFDARKKSAADVDKDGKLTPKDASAILVYYAELTDKGTAKWPFEKAKA